MSQETPKTPDFTYLEHIEPGHYVANYPEAQPKEDELTLVVPPLPPTPEINYILIDDDTEDKPDVYKPSIRPLTIKKEKSVNYNDFKDPDDVLLYDEFTPERSPSPPAETTVPFSVDDHEKETLPNDSEEEVNEEDLKETVEAAYNEHQILQGVVVPGTPVKESEAIETMENLLKTPVHHLNEEEELPITSPLSAAQKARKFVVKEETLPKKKTTLPKKTTPEPTSSSSDDEPDHYHLKGIMALSDTRKKGTNEYTREFKGFQAVTPVPASFYNVKDSKEIIQSIENPLEDFDCEISAWPIKYDDNRYKIHYNFEMNLTTDLALNPQSVLLKFLSSINHKINVIADGPQKIKGARTSGTSTKDLKKKTKELLEEERKIKEEYSDDSDFLEPPKKRSKKD